MYAERIQRLGSGLAINSDKDRVRLARKYRIEYNDLFQAYVCDDLTFQSVNEAIDHARELERNKRGVNVPMWIGAVAVATALSGYMYWRSAYLKEAVSHPPLIEKPAVKVQRKPEPKLEPKPKALTITPAALVGGWAPYEKKSLPSASDLPTICATDTGWGFGTSGKYWGDESSGSYRLRGDNIQLYGRETSHIGEDEDFVESPLPETTIKISVIDDVRLKIDGHTYVRCPDANLPE